MGSSCSTTTRVLVVGLSGVGKTHFLDMLAYNADTTKQPTTGFYEVVYREVCFVEYGGNVNLTTTMLHTEPFDAVVYIVCGETYDKHQLLQAKSHMLEAISRHHGVPLCVVVKGAPARNALVKVWREMQLDCLDPAIICMDFDKKQNFEEGCEKLFGWLGKLHIVTGSSASN